MKGYYRLKTTAAPCGQPLKILEGHKMITATKLQEVNGQNVFLTIGAIYGKKPRIVGLVTASPLFTATAMTGDVQKVYDGLFVACAIELGFKPSKHAKSGFVYAK
jgi:hypothetical protein